MPLTPCPACGHQVSEKAPTCPQCGHPIRTPILAGLKPPAAATGGVGFGALVLIAALVLFFTNPDEAQFRKALAEKVPGFNIGAGIGEFLGTVKYQRQNYYFFSTMSAVGIDNKERTIARGALGQVWVKPANEWQ